MDKMLEVAGLTKRYGDEVAVEELSLAVDDGEFVTLLGPSGAGKTTTLLAIAGHVTPTGGRIVIDGSDVTQRPPEERSLGVVFQQGALFPHMTVAENLGYALDAADVPEDERRERIATHLELVRVGEHADKRPRELSGGERRRVELARAVVADPDLLLLDEPLTGLDRQLRLEMRSEVARIQDETDVTTVYVTHDQEEALSLSDRLVVLRDGRGVARGAPSALYERPPTPFVAEFLGESNALEARVTDGGATLTWQGHRLRLDEPLPPDRDRASISVRPDAMSLGTDGGDDDATGEGDVIAVSGTVMDGVYRGATRLVTVSVDGEELRVAATGRATPGVGDEVTVSVAPSAATVFAGQMSRSVAAVVDE